MNPQMNTQAANHLLNENAVAEILGCRPALLRKWRRVGGGPVFCRIGRLVRYPQNALEEYINLHRVERPQ
jgi:predicted DNA-binding transcriptional regulator AlpA